MECRPDQARHRAVVGPKPRQCTLAAKLQGAAVSLPVPPSVSVELVQRHIEFEHRVKLQQVLIDGISDQ